MRYLKRKKCILQKTQIHATAQGIERNVFAERKNIGAESPVFACQRQAKMRPNKKQILN
jgi:hypothetical protein